MKYFWLVFYFLYEMFFYRRLTFSDYLGVHYLSRIEKIPLLSTDRSFVLVHTGMYVINTKKITEESLREDYETLCIHQPHVTTFHLRHELNRPSDQEIIGLLASGSQTKADALTYLQMAGVSEWELKHLSFPNVLLTCEERDIYTRLMTLNVTDQWFAIDDLNKLFKYVLSKRQ